MLARIGVGDWFDEVEDVCTTATSAARAAVTVLLCTSVMIVLCLSIPSMVRERTKGKCCCGGFVDRQSSFNQKTTETRYH
jgi:hypothetical protein